MSKYCLIGATKFRGNLIFEELDSNTSLMACTYGVIAKNAEKMFNKYCKKDVKMLKKSCDSFGKALLYHTVFFKNLLEHHDYFEPTL